MLKKADDYYHVTSIDNLRNILGSGGKLKTLRHLAADDPNRELDVELSPVPLKRRMEAANAYEKLKKVKNVDEVHFTRGGYLPNYGDVVIRKNLGGSARKRLAANSIPEEYTTRRKVSLRDADIYVPEDQLGGLRAEYGNRYHIRDKAGLTALPYRAWDRAKALGRKAGYKLGLRESY